MALKFRTLISSSSGNCLLIQTENTNILIDCGFKSQKACRLALTQHLEDPSNVDAVITTHNHGDHINYSALKVLEAEDVPEYVFQDSLEQLKFKHFNGYPFDGLNIIKFAKNIFEIGNLSIEPVEIPHHFDQFTFAFVIKYTEEGKEYKIITAADFSDGEDLEEHLTDADFIYIESNHDLEMLEENPNFNSYHHMNNPDTADLLLKTLSKRKTPPKAVMLGHLSTQRNNPKIAIKETKKIFSKNGIKIDFQLTVAPPKKPSQQVHIP